MKSLLNEVSYWAVRLSAELFGRSPRSVSRAVAKVGGTVACLSSSRSRHGYADIKAAFGAHFTVRQRRAIVRRCFQNIALSAFEVMRLPLLDRGQLREMVEVDRPEIYEEALSKGRGVIFLTAHFGNFELLQQLSPALFDRPLHVLGREQKNRKLNELLARYREAYGSVAVGKGMNLRDLIRALKRKEQVGILGDQSAGKTEGVLVRFFGRKTTLPTGAFDIAARTGAALIPAFIARMPSGRHKVFLYKPLSFPAGKSERRDISGAVDQYLRLMEALISEYPDQWIWMKKRWKYTWTKRLVILSDEKPGHLKQSQAVARNMQSLATQHGREGMEYSVQILPVRYRSEFMRKLFTVLTPLMLPWIQGRLTWLRPFFTEETRKALEELSADFILSTGSSLTPLNLCLARECCAKSMVVMKPSFPFNLYRYDLSVVPAHDEGMLPREAIRTFLAPNHDEAAERGAAGKLFREELKHPAKVRTAVFLGGVTKKYRMDLSKIEKLISLLERSSTICGDFVLTTSRRTPAAISHFLKENLSQFNHCQKIVIAAEDDRTHVVPGMMDTAEVLIVTEDSVSMISEAVRTGKKVFVLCLNSAQLPAKHRRFRQLLVEKSAVKAVTLTELEAALTEQGVPQTTDFLEQETRVLRNRLQEIL